MTGIMLREQGMTGIESKATMKKRDHAEGGGMINCAEEGERWCQGTRNVLRAQRMVLSGRGMAPSERGIVEREAMDISEDARDSTKEQDTKTRRATQSNSQQLDLFELNSFK